MTEAPGHKVEGGGERLLFSGMEFVIRASTETTGGAFSVIEENRVRRRASARPPPTVIFGPRGVPHAQRRVVPRVGRILTMFSPAGFEGFFRDLSQAEGHAPVTPEILVEVAGWYDATCADFDSDR